jgi:glutamate-1-semialdehyde 2,1-aminomutase
LIQEALVSAIKDIGLSLGGTTKYEAQHAGLLCERFGLDLIRFTNSGTEANLHALNAAKKFTGKRKVVVFNGGYHGACFMFYTGKPADNVIDKEDFIIAQYNNVEDARSKIEQADNVAAVLIEGMQGGGPQIPATREFLHAVQDSARKAGAVFILDEVMTSRLAPGGIRELEGLKPDMTTLGKYLGGGITFGAFGGREEIMRLYDPRQSAGLTHSGTFNNNTLGMVAGYTGLSKVYTPEVTRDFNAMGDGFREKLQNITQGTKLTVTGRGSLLGLHFLQDGRKDIENNSQRVPNEELSELFWVEMMEDGFWTHKRGNISLMLGTPESELDRFVSCVKEFLTRHAELVRP